MNRGLRHDNKISRQSNFHFQNFIVVAFPTKNRVLDHFPLCPPCPPPLKNAIFIFIVVSLSEFDCGAKFYTPPPPHPWKYPSREGCIKGGGYKIPAAWGLKIYTPPPPSPQKCLLAKNGGEGGGVFIISPWIDCTQCQEPSASAFWGLDFLWIRGQRRSRYRREDWKISMPQKDISIPTKSYFAYSPEKLCEYFLHIYLGIWLKNGGDSCWIFCGLCFLGNRNNAQKESSKI